MWYLNHGSRGSLCLPAVGLWRAAMRQRLPQAAERGGAGRVGGENQGSNGGSTVRGRGWGWGQECDGRHSRKYAAASAKRDNCWARAASSTFCSLGRPAVWGPTVPPRPLQRQYLENVQQLSLAYASLTSELFGRAARAGKSRQEQARAGKSRHCLQAVPAGSLSTKHKDKHAP